MKPRLRSLLTLSTAHMLSGVVHGVGLGGLASWNAGWIGTDDSAADVSFLELEHWHEEPETASEPALEPSAVTTENPSPVVPSPRRAAAVPPSPRTDEREPTPVATEPPDEAEVRREILRSRRTTGDTYRLAPADVALSTLSVPTEPNWRPHEETEQAPEHVLAEQLARNLAESANRRRHVSRRPPPDLRRRSDGSYRFSGPRFSALIRPDGTVRFNDAPGIGVNGPGTDHGLGVAGTFDLTDAFQSAAGQDPMRAERAWFMEETRELRERLMAQADRESEGRALSRLGNQLRAIWSGEQSPSAKRRRLFELWDGSSEDEVGQRARERIVQFIRRELPFGSRNAYTASELDQLNRRRESTERFDPY